MFIFRKSVQIIEVQLKSDNSNTLCEGKGKGRGKSKGKGKGRGKGKGKSKSVPLEAWSGPEGSTKFRLPDYMTTA